MNWVAPIKDEETLEKILNPYAMTEPKESI